MSFAERQLRLTFSGAPTGTFSASGLRAVASIVETEGKLGVTAQAKIWGLSLSQMNGYSTVIPSAIGDEIPNANLVIEAGDIGGALSVAVDGPIWQSNIDLGDAPNSAFWVSVAGFADAATTITSQSQPPQQPGAESQIAAEDMIQSLCAAAGLNFDNSAGAHAPLRNQSTYGSLIQQVNTIARAANLNWIIRGRKLSIWPANGNIDDVIIHLGPNTDPVMVGYPRYYQSGIIVTSLYNPQIQVGRLMNVLGSTLTKANGLWSIVTVQHDLTTMIPQGPWFTTALLAGTGNDDDE